MKFAAFVSGCVLGVCFVAPTWSQSSPASQVARKIPPWWVSMEFGEGQLKLSSDQLQGSHVPTFAMGLAGGYQPVNGFRIGFHANGWLLQAIDVMNAPPKGEFTSNTAGIVDIFPGRQTRLFVRGGLGVATYTNYRPMGVNGLGLGWETGGGYEIPVHRLVRLVPTVEYAAGNLGNGSSDTKPNQTGLHYSAVEFKLSVVGSFGPRKR